MLKLVINYYQPACTFIINNKKGYTYYSRTSHNAWHLALPNLSGRPHAHLPYCIMLIMHCQSGLPNVMHYEKFYCIYIIIVYSRLHLIVIQRVQWQDDVQAFWHGNNSVGEVQSQTKPNLV